MRILAITALALTLLPLFAESPKPIGTVTPNMVEFTIPLPRPANGVWTWNRASTPDNDIEYLWTVTARSGKCRGGTAQHAFGFYLYKFPASRESQGSLRDLLAAGQNSIFREDAEGRGVALPNARVEVTVEKASILVRITDPALVRLIFHDRPQTVAIHSRTPAADYQVVRVNYRD